MRHGPAAANADGVARNDQRRRQLPPLEFVCRRFNSVQDVVNQASIMAGGNDLFRRFLLLEIELEDRIELVIRRQRLIVKLFGRQLSRWPFVDYRNRNELALTIVKSR